MNNRANILSMPCVLDEGIASRARIGLVVLASDHTVEYEFRQVVTMPGVAVYQTRIPNSPKITTDSLRAMETDIAEQAAVILPGIELDVLAYGCTSASIVLGEDRVFELIKEGRPEARPTTPVTAAFAAFRAFQSRRIGVVTPYGEDINRTVRQYFIDNGLQVPVFGSFNQTDDNQAARISTDSIRDAIMSVGSHSEVETVFLSCTSLRLTDRVDDIESQLGKPVTSSNHALIWHALSLAGVSEPIDGYGSLYRLPTH